MRMDYRQTDTTFSKPDEFSLGWMCALATFTQNEATVITLSLVFARLTEEAKTEIRAFRNLTAAIKCLRNSFVSHQVYLSLLTSHAYDVKQLFGSGTALHTHWTWFLTPLPSSVKVMLQSKETTTHTDTLRTSLAVMLLSCKVKQSLYTPWRRLGGEEV
jgi:hypothetical protein